MPRKTPRTLVVCTWEPGCAILEELSEEEIEAPGFTTTEHDPWTRKPVQKHWRRTDRYIPVYELVDAPTPPSTNSAPFKRRTTRKPG